MEKNYQKKIPGLNNHNGFPKIIKNIFHDDFAFDGCWYEKSEDCWVEITSSKFKNTVFKKDGELEKYILGEINSHPDFEELERLLSIYRSIFIYTSSIKQKGYIEKECREVFYEPELKNKITKKYKCIHNRRKYLCVDCDGPSICKHKKIKYRCVDCGGSQICEHKKNKHNCRMCNSSGRSWNEARFLPAKPTPEKQTLTISGFSWC